MSVLRNLLRSTPRALVGVAWARSLFWPAPVAASADPAPVVLAQALNQALNQHDVDTAVTLFTPDALIRQPGAWPAA
jgi:hypothetical protein